MNIKKITIILLSFLLLTGCSKKADSNYIEDAKKAVAGKEYEKAENLFELELEENRKNEEARNLYNQIKLLRQANEKAEQGEYEEAIKLYQKVSTIDSESNVITKQADEYSKQLSEKVRVNNELKTNVSNKIVEAEGLISNEKYEDAKKLLEELLEEVNENSALKKEIEKINELMEECNNKNNNTENTQNNSSSTNNIAYYNNKMAKLEEQDTLEMESGGYSTLEMRITASDSLTRWDNLLNEIYGVLKDTLTKDEFKALQVEQREWIKDRDNTAETQAKEYEGGTMEPLIYTTSQAESTKNRCYVLVNEYMKN